MKSAVLGLAACLAVEISGACWAQDLKATQKLTDTVVGFETGSGYSNFNLTVTGPNGFHASAAAKDAAPSIDLRRSGAFDDGMYNYQLTASSDEKVPLRTPLDNGREGAQSNSMLRPVSASGVFHVKGGTIMKFDTAAKERGARQK